MFGFRTQQIIEIEYKDSRNTTKLFATRETQHRIKAEEGVTYGPDTSLDGTGAHTKDTARRPEPINEVPDHR